MSKPKEPTCPGLDGLRRACRHLAGIAFALPLLPALFPGAAFAVPAPELPRVYIDTTYAPPTGNTVTVNTGGNLQNAINNAQPGDTIVLQAGATFIGPFTLPNKGASTAWIYIRTSNIGALPPPGNRVTPADAPKMATIIGTGSPVIAVQTAPGAHHYRFVGVEFRPGPGLFSTGLFRIGTSAETNLSQLPHNITIDRCYLHGDPNVGARRGIAMNGAFAAVVDSHLSDFKEIGADSQAIIAWNTPGPLKLVNNHLEGAGENIMLGGADPSIPNLIPADIEIRGNRFFKPVAWRPLNWSVKNLFQLKVGRRILLEGNVLEFDWEAAQNFMMNIKSTNQEGTLPTAVTEDFTMRHNIVRHGPNAIKFCGLNCDNPSAQGSRYLVQNNVFEDISSTNWGGSGNFFQTGNPTPGLVINHNTVVHNGSMFSGGDGGSLANTNFEFTDNILQHGPLGFKGTGATDGNGTLNAYFPGAQFRTNVIIGGNAANYPASNFYPGTYQGVGFVDVLNGDYRLLTTSAYVRAGSDTRDVGADITSVNAATACSVSGQCGAPRLPPAVVNPFSFTSQTGIEPGALVTSNIVTVTGSNLTLPVTISITGGGSYSIACGPRLTATTGLINPGQTFCVRYNAPSAVNTNTNTTITVNGVSSTFSTTTASTMSPTGDADNDGIPNAVELAEARNQVLKDNDIFANARLFSMQQYRDFLGREGDAGGVNYYANLITTGLASRPAIIESFFRTPEHWNVAPPVVRLYFAAFLRFPDYGGLVFQINTVRAGTPLTVVANNFTLSPEFQDRYGSLNNAQYVTLLYQNILGRTPTPSELAFHVNRLDTGATRGEVLVGFSESPEYQALYTPEVDVILVYVAMQKRMPNPTEFNSWFNFLNAGNDVIGMITTFYNGTEYRARGFLP